MWGNRQLQGTDTVYRKRASSPSSCLFAFLVFAALICGGCQSPLPPLPNPPGPQTAVRLSPGDVIKASYADETIPDQTQKIRRDGKVSLPLIGEVTAAGKRVIDFQHELVRRYEGQLDKQRSAGDLGERRGNRDRSPDLPINRAHTLLIARRRCTRRLCKRVE